MKTKHIFGLLVRIVGLIAIIIGFYHLVEFADIALGVILGNTAMFEFSRWKATLVEYVVHSLLFILLGLYLLRGAPHIVRFAYRDDHDA